MDDLVVSVSAHTFYRLMSLAICKYQLLEYLK